MKYDLIFEFQDVCVDCRLDCGLFSDADRIEAKKILESIAKGFLIDKTFVDFDGSKYEKTFMTEDGWNTLCETARCKRKSAHDKYVLDEAYRLMAECYIEQFFADLGWPVEGMLFEVRPDSKMKVTFTPDTIEEWKTYPGKWQTW